MKKMVLVISMLMLFSLAASAADTVYNFTLRDTSGNPYCNVVYVRLYKPAAGFPKAVVGGWYYNPGCNGTYAPAGGFKHGISPLFQYSASGPVLDFTTPGYWNSSTLTGFSWELLINPVYHTWAGYQAGDYYGNYLINYGTWVNGTGPEQAGTKDATAR
jgi:hypothetical protein